MNCSGLRLSSWDDVSWSKAELAIWRATLQRCSLESEVDVGAKKRECLGGRVFVGRDEYAGLYIPSFKGSWQSPIFLHYLKLISTCTKKNLFERQNEYANLKTAQATSKAEGIEEGRMEERMKTVKSAIRSGVLSISKISEILGLDIDYIKKIKASMQLNEA